MPNPSSPRHLEHPKPERLAVNEPWRHRLNHLLRAHRMGGMIEEPDCNDNNICSAKNGADEVAARDAVGHDSASRRSSRSRWADLGVSFRFDIGFSSALRYSVCGDK